MNTFQRNQRTMQALGIASIHFAYYRQARAQWIITMKDGSTHNVSTAGFGTESTVLRAMAEKLAKMGKPVTYPKGA